MKKAAKKATAKQQPRKQTAKVEASAERSALEPAIKKAATESGTASRTAPAAMSPVTGVPNIDYSLCQGCGGCAEAFPHLFEMRGERAWLTDPEGFDPVRDAGIMTICPYYAISIEKVWRANDER